MHDFKIFRTYIRKVLIENLDDGQILSQYAHRGQKRRTGEPYFFHPQGVANIVKNIIRQIKRHIMQHCYMMQLKMVYLWEISKIKMSYTHTC